MVSRRASEVVTPEVQTLKNEIEHLKSQLGNVGHVVASNARSRMHDALNEKLPNWMEINESEKFIDWLSLPDAYSGAIRHQLLKAAYAANDTSRVLAFFQGFLSEEAAKAPPKHDPDPVSSGVPKVPLESLAAPGRARTAAPASTQSPAEKPFISRADVTSFYADLARGVYRGRDDEKNRIEKMIFDAQRDGRIR